MINSYILLVKTPKGRDHSENLGTDGNIILEWIVGKHGGEGVDWMHLAQDRDKWRGVLNMIMNP